MLKRQRPASPPPTFFEPSVSPSNKRFRIAPLPERSHPSSSSSASPQHPRNPEETQEPAITNNYLYEVHALHRHRLLFASQTPVSAISDSQGRAPPSLHPTTEGANDLEHVGRSDSKPETIDHSTSESRDNDTELVKERYSETNRFLGSLVLARRRAVHGSEGEPS